MPSIQSTVEYRDIKDFPGYRIGSDGSVWSKWEKLKVFPQRSAIGNKWVQLRQGLASNGYFTVALHPGKKTFCIHKLVLMTFVGPCPEGMEARHFPDRDRTNSALSNLSWAPHSVNMQDKLIQGTHNGGENCYCARLTADIVRQIRSEWSSKAATQTAFGKRFGVHPSVISKIISRKRWASVD